MVEAWLRCTLANLGLTILCITRHNQGCTLRFSISCSFAGRKHARNMEYKALSHTRETRGTGQLHAVMSAAHSALEATAAAASASCALSASCLAHQRHRHALLTLEGCASTAQCLQCHQEGQAGAATMRCKSNKAKTLSHGFTAVSHVYT